MTIRPRIVGEQNSAYGPTASPRVTRNRYTSPMAKTHSSDKPYPDSWENVADLRVFRTPAAEWEKLIAWRNDMLKRGWKLLRVTNARGEITAVFGRTKSDKEG